MPEITAPVAFASCLDEIKPKGPSIMLWEEERQKSLKDAARESLRTEAEHVSVFIGPIGGFSVAEADAARSNGAVLAGAGPRILRAETAPLAALTALMYEADQLG